VRFVQLGPNPWPRSATYIDNSCNVALDWCTTEEQIYLIVIISKSPQILNDSETGLTIGDSGIHVMLFSMFIDAESLKGQITPRTELWLHWSWLEDW
jgi:hypothetical protein